MQGSDFCFPDDHQTLAEYLELVYMRSGFFD